MNEAYLNTIKDLVKRGHGAGLYGRIADFEIVAISAVLLELVKLTSPPPRKPKPYDYASRTGDYPTKEANKHGR